MLKKSIIAAGLAAALAGAGFADSALARPPGPPPGSWSHGHPRYHRGGSDIGPAIVAGTVFGLIGAAIANSYDRPYYRTGGPRSHVAWCEWRYKTYNPATDTYYARPGVPAYCHSPYD